MERRNFILTRSIPKTGRVASQETNDDGDIQAGWWRGRTYANNRNRFVAKTLDGDNVTIDLATGLMWPKAGDGPGCMNAAKGTWSEVIAYANALDLAGFTDWRLPNINELISIGYYGGSSPKVVGTYFSLYSAGVFWSSTFAGVGPLTCYTWNTTDLTVDIALSSTDQYMVAVRGGL